MHGAASVLSVSLESVQAVAANFWTTLTGGGEGDAAASTLDGISGAVHGLLDVLDTIGPIAAAAWLALGEGLVNAYNAMQPSLEAFREWLGTNIPLAVDALREKWDALSAELGPTFTMAWQVIEPILAGLKDWLGTQIPQVAETVKGAIGGLFSFIGTMVGQLAELLGPFKDQFGGALHEFNQRVQEALAANRPIIAAETAKTAEVIRQEFIHGTAPIVPALAETGEQAGEALAAPVRAAARTAAASVPTAVQAIAPAAEQAGETVGAAIAQGVEAGMEERKGATIDRFSSLLGAVIQGGRNAIRAQSPSQVAAEQIGVPLVEGIAQGFEQALPSAISSMGDHLSRALTGSLGLQAKQAAQEFWNVREGAFPRETFGIGSVNSARNAEAFQSSQREWAQSTFGTSDLSSILLPDGSIMTRDQFAKLTGGTGGARGRSTSPVNTSGQSVDQYFEATKAAGGGETPAITGGTGLATSLVFGGVSQDAPTEGDQLRKDMMLAAQNWAVVAANAKALADHTSTIASISQAFSAYALHPSPGLGNPSVTNTGSGAFTAAGGTGGGQAYAALLALGQQVTANHPELSGEAQARAIQDAMRTDRNYLRVVGTLTDTTRDLERQQNQATDDVFNLRSVAQSLGGAFAAGTGVSEQLATAEAHLASITDQLAGARATAITATGPIDQSLISNTARNLPNPGSVAVNGVYPGSVGGIIDAGGGNRYLASVPTLTVPSGGGLPGTSGGVVFTGDINVQGSGVSTAQDAAAFMRQVREEARRQGVDLTRMGGV
jgi:hypothetical protein